LSQVFFDELSLPEPAVNLSVGSGSHAWQTGQVMIHSEEAIRELGPEVVLVPGDTNSTLGGALAAVKLHLPVAHLEAGARSFDLSMPEEVNRRLTDHCSRLLLVPTENCKANLLREDLPAESVRLVGDTMYDALLEHLPRVEEAEAAGRLGLQPGGYVLFTLHRPENVDNPERLRGFVRAIRDLNDVVVVFPLHPRTRSRLEEAGLVTELRELWHVRLVEPLGYHESLGLMRQALAVLTDSGGMQKEAFWLGTPCLTLRDTTEWVETVSLGANVLVGGDAARIVDATRRLLREDMKKRLRGLPNPFGDGKASARVVEALRECPAWR